MVIMQTISWLSQILSRGWRVLSRSGEGLAPARVGRAGRRDAGSSVGGGGHSVGAGTPSKVAGTSRRRSRRGGSMPVGGNNQGAAFEIKLLNETLPTYEIRQVIDQGGQGTVYRAIQKSTGRTCALKVLHFDPHATQQRHHRFEREVSLLSRLRHPNVVTIYECGLAGNRPYLSMELIDGLPIDDYILFNRPSIEQCVALFEKICRAVATVHQRGVIHRDLKPSNILVDLEGEPHILDFGLAKCFDEDAREQSISMAGQMIGTLPYQSPEQVSAEGGDPDTRSDVYALGVILHELLTGEMPYSVDGPPVSVQKNILGVTPGPLARRGESESETCAVGPISIDLSHVVLKALSKEPDRRYQSADALADDLRRCMKGEAISARGDSGWYQFRKTMRKYRVHTAIAASFAVVLATSAVVSTVLFRRANANATRADESAKLAIANATRADESAKLAEANANEAQRTARNAQSALYLNSKIQEARELRDQRQLDRAFAAAKEAIIAGEKVQNPDFEGLRQLFLAYQHVTLQYLNQIDDLPSARYHAMRAIHTAELIKSRYPDERESREVEALSLSLTARMFEEEGDWSNAKKTYRECLILRRFVMRSDGTFADRLDENNYRLDQRRLAYACAKCGEMEEALPLLAEVRRDLERLSLDSPEYLSMALDLIQTESRLSNCLMTPDFPEYDWCAIEVLDCAEQRLRGLRSSIQAEYRQAEVLSLTHGIVTNKALLNRRLNLAAQMDDLLRKQVQARVRIAVGEKDEGLRTLEDICEALRKTSYRYKYPTDFALELVRSEVELCEYYLGEGSSEQVLRGLGALISANAHLKRLPLTKHAKLMQAEFQSVADSVTANMVRAAGLLPIASTASISP